MADNPSLFANMAALRQELRGAQDQSGRLLGMLAAAMCDAYAEGHRDALERAAKVADDHTPAKHEGTLSSYVTGSRIAAAIRALPDPEPAGGEHGE